MKYSEPVGIAFQIKDDILGIFGDSALTGKSNDSDIREGKMTLLYSKALEKGTKAQRIFMKRFYGNKNIGKDKIDKIKEIIIRSESLDECQDIAIDLVNKGKKYTRDITEIKRYREVLDTLADYIVDRKR